MKVETLAAMRLLCPGKINLHLRVAPADSSGFHPLLSWFCTVGLFDTLTLDATGDASLSLTCDTPTLPCDASNLVIRAADALRREIPPAASISRGYGMRAVLEKRIPTGGGLGGGSSDAARALLALNRLWHLDWPLQTLARLSAALGSDVTFFLHGGSAVCTGRGEIVRPLAAPVPRRVVLILPSVEVATPAVYRMFDQMRLGDREMIANEPDWRQWAQLPAEVLLARLVNDLEPPAFAICPTLAELRADVEQSLGRVVRMSGSGSSLFTLFDDPVAARSAAERIAARFGVRAVDVELTPTFEDDLVRAA